MSLAMRNRIVTSGREINVDGLPVDSPTRDLAKGQEGVRAFVGEFLEAEDRIIRNDTLNEKGTKKGIREAAEATIKKLQSLKKSHSNRAKIHLGKWEEDLKLVDDDDGEKDVKIFLWTTLREMNKEERNHFANQAFADGNTPVIRAVLSYAALFPDVFLAQTVAAWKKEYATARNPNLAREFSTLQENIGKFEFDVEQAILHVSEHVGIGDTTLRERTNKAQAAILESQREAVPA